MGSGGLHGSEVVRWRIFQATAVMLVHSVPDAAYDGFGGLPAYFHAEQHCPVGSGSMVVWSNVFFLLRCLECFFMFVVSNERHLLLW
jgi:hypothetical protein